MVMILVKKQYTALAVSIDTRSEEEIEARKARGREVLATAMYFTAPLSDLCYFPSHNTFENNSRIHKGSAFKEKRR